MKEEREKGKRRQEKNDQNDVSRKWGHDSYGAKEKEEEK
jgi:hypothetical protein